MSFQVCACNRPARRACVGGFTWFSSQTLQDIFLVHRSSPEAFLPLDSTLTPLLILCRGLLCCADGGGSVYEFDDEIEVSPEDEAALAAFLAPGADSYHQRTLADMVMDRIREKQAEEGVSEIPRCGPGWWVQQRQGVGSVRSGCVGSAAVCSWVVWGFSCGGGCHGVGGLACTIPVRACTAVLVYGRGSP